MTPAGTVEVTFRGTPREVEYYYEGDDVIVWSFVGENVTYGVDTTEQEQQQIMDQLWPLVQDHFAWEAEA